MPEGEFEGKVSVITCDMTGTVQQYAADAEELFGWPRDRVIGRMSVPAFHLPKNVPTLVPRLLREAVEKGKFEEEVRLQRRAGSTFPALLTARPTGAGARWASGATPTPPPRRRSRLWLACGSPPSGPRS